jgi:hypothetical protein
MCGIHRKTLLRFRDKPGVSQGELGIGEWAPVHVLAKRATVSTGIVVQLELIKSVFSKYTDDTLTLRRGYA